MTPSFNNNPIEPTIVNANAEESVNVDMKSKISEFLKTSEGKDMFESFCNTIIMEEDYLEEVSTREGSMEEKDSFTTSICESGERQTPKASLKKKAPRKKLSTDNVSTNETIPLKISKPLKKLIS